MKVVILGGGIAGLATAISLKKIGFEVVVKERAEEFKEVGLGFIILPNGLNALDELGAGAYVRQHGLMLEKAILRSSEGLVFKEENISNSLAIKRSTSLDSLRQLLPAHLVHNGFEFSHFEFDAEGKALAAISSKGEREEGDVFIGADGAGSRSRKILFPHHEVRHTVIQELVGIVDSPVIAASLGGHLLKTYSFNSSLSLGILPCNQTQVIWYMQFDSSVYHLDDYTSEGKKQFVEQSMSDWADPIKEVLSATSFDQCFLWQTKDMELPPQFHQENILLIGDAAHLALPFTSQGTNSALQDAIVLAEIWQEDKNIDLNHLFTHFYNKRKDELKQYVAFGRKLEEIFLNPQVYNPAESPIPLAK